MKKIVKLIFKKGKRRYAAVSAIIVIVAATAYFITKNNDDSLVYAEVKRGDIIEKVSATGKVKPAESVDLAFETSGKISSIKAVMGKRVNKGDTLIILSNEETAASLEAEKAKLAELRQGTREEEIKVQKAEVSSARDSLEEAEKSLIDALRNGYAKTDSAIRAETDQLFNNPDGTSVSLNFNISDQNLKIDLIFGRIRVGEILQNWKKSLVSTSLLSDLEQYSAERQKDLSNIRLFLSDLSLAVSDTPNTAYGDLVSSARENINTAIDSINSAVEKWRKAKSALALEEENLRLKKSGSRTETIAAQEAVVKQYEARMAKTILRSPISGIITKIDAETGEIAIANEKIISVISDGLYEIEVNIPEVDVAKTKVGQEAEITLDAYGPDEIFPAVISEIEPAETVVEGVSTYKTILVFIQNDQRIRSGMTANIDIITDKRKNVLAAPSRAIRSKNNHKYVIVGKEEKEKVVEVGLKGIDGLTEIKSGLKEGDLVLVSSPKEK